MATDGAGEKLKGKMIDIRVKEKEQEATAVAASLNIPYINLFRFPITPNAISLISKEEAVKLKTICFLFTGEEIRLGSVEPDKEKVKELLHTLEERHHAHGALYLISEHSLSEAFHFYETLPIIKSVSKDVSITEADLKKFEEAISSLAELKKQLSISVNISDIITIMIAAALKFDASDIHVEAKENEIEVRFRLDGILQEVSKLNKDLWSRVASRVKLISGLKINITNKPQDGRFTIVSAGQKVDVRVSTIPTVFGESLVMRVLKPLAAVWFEELGLQDEILAALKRQIKKPTGMVVTTGPTGSGKTTTLYSILQQLNKPGVKIITLEDPVEYKLPGINQSQIDAGRDYTFAKGLRSILRQDPDVVMVGEIRDLETAEVAIQAALTGHFMLSTIHTNSAAGAIPRFLSMGVKPFLLAPALNAVMGQRLVRRLCQKCRTEAKLDEEIMAQIKESLGKLLPEVFSKKNLDLNNLKFYTSPGCGACDFLGYKGRIGIYELMEMNKELEGMVLKSEASNYVIEEAAVRNGMIKMVQDGLLKALAGITSVDEVFRVAQ